MRIQTYGTRGSSPIARPQSLRYGGNTTCIRVKSSCLPADTALLVDAGTGIVPASMDLLREGIRHVLLLMTHYHHDHTQGFPLAPHTFAPGVQIEVFGPREHGVGPEQTFATLMQAPFFPVDFAHVRGRVTCHDLDGIGSQALVIHPDQGARLVPTGMAEAPGAPRTPSSEGSAPAASLIVRMHRTAHPEHTVSYRFEEGPTGKVAVLLTDHEHTDILPESLRAHLARADLLIQDAQYTQEQYLASRVGFGHGTGAYAARVMHDCQVARLALTHHDPMANDTDIDAIVEEARAWLRDHGAPELAGSVFGAADYQEVSV